MILVLAWFLVGLVLLVVGAEALVRGSSRLAAALGVSPLIIGLTVVAFGTSAPEMAVSVKAALAGQADIAVGNVVGSNIFNVLGILGISALIVPLVISPQLLRFDVPVMIAVSVLIWGFCLDGVVSRLEGALLFAGLVAYVLVLISLSRRENRQQQEARAAAGVLAPSGGGKQLVNLVLVLGGLGLLVLGAKWLVDGAVEIAHYLGVSELIIGLTIVAIGTSLPELVTSVVAGLRGERDIAVGNIVGSNIFNILGVLGAAGMIDPAGLGVSAMILSFDLPVMAAVAIICLPIFLTGQVISRWEGALLLVGYAAYTAYLILNATGHPALPMFRTAMLLLALPLAGLLLMGEAMRASPAAADANGATGPP